MKVALIGVGRMGSAIAERLRAGGFQLRTYDLRPGLGDSASIGEAAAGAEVVLFSLPDGKAVEAAAGELTEPALLIDLTSSHPQVTRHVAAQVRQKGIDMVDAPLSGGVGGARLGRLTAMLGGSHEDLERARPVLRTFASNIVLAGPLGAGDTVKAVNNALSAVALTVSCDMLVRAAAAGCDPVRVVEAWNAAKARTQNSEVKLPRDVLSGAYAAGFTAGLMEKDVSTALDMARGHDLEAPTVAAVGEAWGRFVRDEGPEADFTRVHAWLTRQRRPALDPESGGKMIHNVCLAAGRELIAVTEAEGLDSDRVLDIINASTGRSEATRARLAGDFEEVPEWPWSI